MQSSLLLLSSMLLCVNGQYQCPTNPPATTTTAPPPPPTYQCPTTTTTAPPPPTTTQDSNTTTTAPPPPPTYQCPTTTTTTPPPPTTTQDSNTTTTAFPPPPTYQCINDSTTTTTAPPTTTSSPPTNSCLYPPQCDSCEALDPYFSPNYSPTYDQIITAGGDHSNYDNECSTKFKFLNDGYMLVRSVTFNDGTSQIKPFFYVPIKGVPGAYRAEGLNGGDGSYELTGHGHNTSHACDTCVFNDYYLGQPCNGTYVLKRCYIYGSCVDEYNPSTYIVFSTTPYISNECYGPIQDLIGTNFTTLPRKYNSRCVTKIGTLEAISYKSVDPKNSITVAV